MVLHQHPSLTEDRDQIRDRTHELHVMLYDDYGGLPCELPDDFRHVPRLFARKPGRGFVQEDQPGRAGDDQGDLRTLALPVGEPAGHRFGDAAEGQALQGAVCRAARADGVPAPARSQPHVFANADSLHEAWNLGLGTHAESRDAVRRPAGHILAAKPDFPFARLQQPRHTLEEGALSRTVRPDQASQFAFAKAEINPVNRGDAAKVPGQPDRLENRGRHQGPGSARRGRCTRRFLGGGNRRASCGTSPRGSNSTASTRSAPMMTMLLTSACWPRRNFR